MANFTQNNMGNTCGAPFKKGNAGRPRGARNKATLAVEAPAGRVRRTAADLTAAQGAVIAAMARASHIPIPSLHPDYPSPTFSVRPPL
jgi:uncharacterized protein (DUF2345 family)